MQQNVHGSLAACKTTFEHDDVNTFKDFITQEELQGVFQDVCCVVVFFFATASHPPTLLHRGPVTEQGKSLGRPNFGARSHPQRQGWARSPVRRGEARRPSLPQPHRRHFHGRAGSPPRGRRGSVRGPAGRRRLRPVLRHGSAPPGPSRQPCGPASTRCSVRGRGGAPQRGTKRAELGSRNPSRSRGRPRGRCR